MEQDNLKILFFGDITGRQGRNALKSFLSSLDLSRTFVIANIENASHGFGLTKKNYKDLSEAGINCFTSGNHIWDKKDIYEYIEEATNLVRPINYPNGTLGKGSQLFEFKGFKIGVINALGRVFMPPMDSPWQIVVEEINSNFVNLAGLHDDNYQTLGTNAKFKINGVEKEANTNKLTSDHTGILGLSLELMSTTDGTEPTESSPIYYNNPFQSLL